jgi:putative ABC transport system substrate-binding protein
LSNTGDLLGAGAMAAWPIAARTQQSAMPLVGFLRSTAASGFEHLETALRKGLGEEEFVEGRNIVIEYRYANNERDRWASCARALRPRS